MKILFFVSSLNAGGAERVAATLASAWARRGDEVTLVPTYLGSHESFYPLDPGVRLQWLSDRVGRRSRPVSAAPRIFSALRALVRETRPDVVLSFLTNVNVKVLLALRGLDVPVVVCERTNPAHSRSSGTLLRLARRWLYPSADAVTVQVQDSVQAMHACVPGLRTVAVMPNPLPADLPAAGRAQAQPGARRCLVALGRLVPIKQFDLLVRVFGRLAPEYPEWDLRIWGEGPQRAALQAQIDAAGLAQRVQLPGRTRAPWDELARADAFAMTSRVEGFPNALLEAMALGLPCVALDCPSGPAEMTRHGEDALLVPLDDEAGLQAALQRLLSDAVLRGQLGAGAAASVRQRYALPAVLACWDALFEQVRRKEQS